MKGMTGGGQGSLDEKKVLGGAINNYTVKYKITIGDYFDGGGNAGVDPVLTVNNDNINSRAAISAAIYVLSGCEDMSNGATAWDGIDQAAMTSAGTYKNYINHQKVWGWSISDEHWKIWKGSIENLSWARSQLAARNRKFGTSGFAASQNSTNGSGKVRAFSASTYGSTIFWKIK